MVSGVAIVTQSYMALIASVIVLFSTLSSCSCPSNAPVNDVVRGSVSENDNAVLITAAEDVAWVQDQIQLNGLHVHNNIPRKGINPRTRAH